MYVPEKAYKGDHNLEHSSLGLGYLGEFDYSFPPVKQHKYHWIRCILMIFESMPSSLQQALKIPVCSPWRKIDDLQTSSVNSGDNPTDHYKFNHNSVKVRDAVIPP